jgi:rRNA maturation endonuclease Nob1
VENKALLQNKNVLITGDRRQLKVQLAIILSDLKVKAKIIWLIIMHAIFPILRLLIRKEFCIIVCGNIKCN